MGDWLFGAVLLAGCLGSAFVLAGMETGVSALSRFRLRGQMRKGMRRAQLLHSYLDNPEEFLWTILVGNTFAALGALGLISCALYNLAEGRLGWFATGFAVALFLFYLFCELLPKLLFRQFPNRLCLGLALPFRLLQLALTPLVTVLTWLSDSRLRSTGRKRFKGTILSSRREVRLAIQESAHILSADERAMVDRVLDLQDLTVRSIVVPLARVIGIQKTATVREVVELFRQHPVHRLPVWDGAGASRRTIGIASLSALLYASELDLDQPVSRYAKPPLVLREDVRLEEALRRMQRTRQRTALVLHLDDREMGIVNLRDILKSIFGEVTL